MKPIQINQTGSRRKLSGVLAVVLALAFCLPACSETAGAKADAKKAAAPAASGSSQVLAVVNGKPITEAEVQSSSAEQFAQLEREFESNKHQLLESQVDQMIQERLLEAEAAAKGVSKEQILAEIKPPEISDADVDKFYEENKAQIPRPKDQVAGQIKQYLQQRGQAESRQKFYDGLQAKYKVEKKIEPMRAAVATNGPAKGPATAPVTIVEFSDFQCPYCSRLLPTLEQVKAKYGDKVRIVFRQYPLPMHPNAQKAAEASLCANEQGKFWEMHDAMFKNQQELAVDNLKAKAAALGLKADTFNQCLDSGKYVAQVQADQKEGSANGVQGTPAMFINGRFINGAVPLEQITSVIDDELRRKGGA
jgi:protein-disulfide isomerase